MDPIVHTISTIALMFVTWKAGYWYGTFIQRNYALEDLFAMFQASVIDAENKDEVE
jgi:hypothetical protein